QLVRDHQPQVIVLDLSMPGRSGLELLRQLHDDHPTVRVLVLTMHAEEQY
ncbi:response regulator, partial [Enterobacter asburiae]